MSEPSEKGVKKLHFYIVLAIAIFALSGYLKDIGTSVDARYVKTLKQEVRDEGQDKLISENKQTMGEFMMWDQVAKLERQLYDMKVMWGMDMAKWTDAQRRAYFDKKTEMDRLKMKLEKKKGGK
jgi:hypothetical protein